MRMRDEMQTHMSFYVTLISVSQLTVALLLATLRLLSVVKCVKCSNVGTCNILTGFEPCDYMAKCRCYKISVCVSMGWVLLVCKMLCWFGYRLYKNMDPSPSLS